MTGRMSGSTGLGRPGAAPGAAPGVAAARQGGGPCAPLVILTYAHAGAELLTHRLSASRSLACTAGTGVLPLCHDALSAWRRAEGRDGPASPLAVKSVRALVTSMITVIQASGGGSRWCETAFTGDAVAQSFLQVFPEAQFLCLHRSLPEIYREATHAYPWGLSTSPFWRYSAANPGNNVATVAAYWAARTEALLEFEAQNPGSCQRIRYEDVSADRPRHLGVILARLGVDASDLGGGRGSSESQVADLSGSGAGAQLPEEWMPLPLLAKVRDLHAKLGYEHPVS